MQHFFTAAQLKSIDRATCQAQGLTETELVKRAAAAFVTELLVRHPEVGHVVTLSGVGNNGADGLAVALSLLQHGVAVTPYLLHSDKEPSVACAELLTELSHQQGVTLIDNQETVQSVIESIPVGTLIVDALFGMGLSRPLDGLAADLVRAVNQRAKADASIHVISVDLPSGLLANASSTAGAVIRAHETYTFEQLKLAFMMPENARYTGQVTVVEIGLDQQALREVDTNYHLVEQTDVARLLKVRQKFAHKGHYGRALLAGGSYGKIGAIRLATEACLRTGAGMATAYVPKCGYDPLQTGLPEAMVITDADKKQITSAPPIENYTAIGIGPGMGTDEQSAAALKAFLEKAVTPLVLDADAINLLGLYPFMQQLVPANSVLTPHAREFRRVAGQSSNDFEALERLRSLAKRMKSYVLFKGAHTAIAAPDGQVYFNNTGNPGMATAGSGDVLTGIIVGLLAQGYDSLESCLLGTWLHGLAGDLAAEAMGQETLVAGDLIRYLGRAFAVLRGVLQ